MSNLLEGKNALVFGVANERSIAWGVAKGLHDHGAKVGLSYAVEALKKRVVPLGEQIGANFIEECDVTNDEAIAATVEKAKKQFGQIDILVHSIAFAGRDELKGFYYDVSREAWLRAMEISVFSFTALAAAFSDILAPRASLMTMTYYASQKTVPNYNVMGVAKAALEASTRYLARDLGPRQIRVKNTISAGPIRTLSAAGVGGFPLRCTVSLLRRLRSARTSRLRTSAMQRCSCHPSFRRISPARCLYVDSGFNIIGIAADDEKEEA